MNIEKTEEKGDGFDEAFSQFTAPGEASDGETPAAGVEKAEDDAAPPPADGAPADGQPGDDPPGEAGGDDSDSGDSAAADGDSVAADEVAPPEAGEKPAADPAPEPKAKADAAPDDADEILNRLSKLVREAPKEEAPADAKADKPGDDAGDEPPLFSKEEQEFLSKYDEDWGDVVKGEALKRRAEYRELLKYVFDQVVEFVKPLQETAETLAERTHLTDIKENVADYSDQLRDDVIEWTKTQPEYLQVAYNHVITSGTVAEVKDLVDRYRASTGKAAPAAPAPKKPKDNELSSEVKQAAAALAPVESKRSGVQQPGDPSDFDDAWKQFSSGSV